MAKEKVKIGIANETEKSFDIEEVEKWVPTNVSHFSDTVYFKHNGVFYSITKKNFDKIFPNK